MQEDSTQTAANNNRHHESHRHRFMLKARQTRELHSYTPTTKHTKSKPLSLYSTESHIQHGPDRGNNQNPQKQEKQRQQNCRPQQSSNILLMLQCCEVRRWFSREDWNETINDCKDKEKTLLKSCKKCSNLPLHCRNNRRTCNNQSSTAGLIVLPG